MIRDTQYVVYRQVTEMLFQLTGSDEVKDKKASACLLGLIETLAVDFEEILFNFSLSDHRSKFPIDLSGYCSSGNEKTQCELYVVERFVDPYEQSERLSHIILCAKLLHTPASEYRLFLYADKEISHIVYLYLQIRPFDHPDFYYTWDEDILCIYTMFKNEKERYLSNENLTGAWSWR